MKIKLFRYGFAVAAMVLAFLFGRSSVGDEMFWNGYDAAMGHVRTTIETNLNTLEPFYLADLGIRFVPRGKTILAVKMYDSGPKAPAGMEVRACR